jgi:competence protein ComGD
VNNRGFTLIETLLVLSIVFIISSVTIFNFNPHKNIFIDQLFISQLQSDLYFAQQYAISHQKEVTVHIDQVKNNYTLSVETKPILERVFTTEVVWEEASLLLTFRFLRDGNINKIGVIYFTINQRKYKLTILLGKGRFYVVES